MAGAASFRMEDELYGGDHREPSFSPFPLLPPVERFVARDRMKVVILLSVSREAGEQEM